jgi:uncharacterized ferredoxin-like protein
MDKGIDSMRAEIIRTVGRLCAAAAVTAPKSGGQLFLKGKPLFIETVLVDDRATLKRLADWMRARGRAADVDFDAPELAALPGTGTLPVKRADRRWSHLPHVEAEE